MKKSTALQFTLGLLTAISVTGCGFQLRGAEGIAGYPLGKSAQNSEENRKMARLKLPPVQLVTGTTLEDFNVKKALSKQLLQLGGDTISVTNPVSNSPDTNSGSNTTAKYSANLPSIQVSNIRVQTFQLRGILTEIRLVLSADVHYHIVQNGKTSDITNNLQVQRSYQYNQASVSTDNPQADQIKLWLYDNLAERIADQYLALNLSQAKN